jgi:hypothetical protein
MEEMRLKLRKSRMECLSLRRAVKRMQTSLRVIHCWANLDAGCGSTDSEDRLLDAFDVLRQCRRGLGMSDRED